MERSSVLATDNLFSQSRLSALLQQLHDKAYDVHIREGEPVYRRIQGALESLDEVVADRDEIFAFVTPLMRPGQIEMFDQTQEMDFACQASGLFRMRLNLFVQRRRLCVAIRLLPEKIPSMKEIYLPKACEYFCSLQKGLVLVTGPTGSGKSTTIAAMLDEINASRPCHILTIEDPIEYVHVNKRAMVSQREVGDDSASFAEALRRALRQDPDVVLLGEMRDAESMEIALTMSETGHLTFSTLHTGEAAQTISRIVNAFPAHRQETVRMQLSTCLAGIISQQLIPLKNKSGRVAAREVLVVNRGVANLIRENKLEQITTAMQTGSSDLMFTMNYSVSHLYKSGFISYEVASQAAFDRREFLSTMCRWGVLKGKARTIVQPFFWP
jgi:twitching motility protein PilT